jgi:hypothetical protein
MEDEDVRSVEGGVEIFNSDWLSSDMVRLRHVGSQKWAKGRKWIVYLVIKNEGGRDRTFEDKKSYIGTLRGCSWSWLIEILLTCWQSTKQQSNGMKVSLSPDLRRKFE